MSGGDTGADDFVVPPREHPGIGRVELAMTVQMYLTGLGSLRRLRGHSLGLAATIEHGRKRVGHLELAASGVANADLQQTVRDVRAQHDAALADLAVTLAAVDENVAHMARLVRSARAVLDAALAEPPLHEISVHAMTGPGLVERHCGSTARGTITPHVERVDCLACLRAWLLHNDDDAAEARVS